MRSAAFSSGALLLLGVASACNGKMQTSSGGATPAAPHIACDAPSFDFGSIVQGDALRHAFRMRNTGSAPLRIVRVDFSYSCSALTPLERVGPGETADLHVECDTDDRVSRIVDKLVVHSDDPEAPEFELHVEARVQPLLAFVSRTVTLNAAFGQKESQVDRLTGKFAADAHLELEAQNPGGPEVTIAGPEPGQAQGLRFTLAAAAVGEGAGQVVVTTGLEKPKTLTVLWAWRVASNLTVDPTNPFIDLRAPGPGGVTLNVSSIRDDFRLNDARVIDGPFEAHVVHDGVKQGYSVEVRLNEDHVDEVDRGWVGKVRLMSNDPAEPRKDVPLFALGAPTPSAQ